MVKRILTLLLVAAAGSSVLSGENAISVDTSLYNTVMRTRDASSDPYWAYGIAGTGELSFKSTGSSDVRADFSLDIIYPELNGQPLLSIQKASIKAKFPDFRITVGKNRLSWGEGFVFNSADVIFGSTSPDVSLIGSELRTETTWLTSVNYPLGRYSFVEALVKAPDFNGSYMGKIEDSGAGVRVYTKAGGIKVEAGYYFDGTDSDVQDNSVSGLHRPYVSFQGNIGPDWHLSSSVSFPAMDGGIVESVALDTFSISGGLFHLQEAGYNNTLTFRVEAVVFPFLNWSEDSGTRGSYSLLIYPEIALGLGQNVSLSLRSIISPVDLSAMITLGYNWNIFEGFYILANAVIYAGDGDDTYSWSRTDWDASLDSIDGISFLTGVQYIY
jgi:hypothetical protein